MSGLFPTYASIEYLSTPSFDYAFQRGWNGIGWYFWDEVGQNCYGPYNTALEAEMAVDEYAKTL
jgi:hypothetical protein